MKKRWIALLLAALLVWTPRTARAEDGDLFAPVRAYGGQFADVSGDDWYCEYVAALYELGLTEGKGSADRYAPGDDVTVGELLTMAARLRSLYEYGDGEAGAAAFGGGAWYLPYVLYLQSEGAAGTELAGRYELPATRAETAHILAHALPDGLLEPVNDVWVAVGYGSGRFIPDVDAGTAYREDILQMYRWGVLTGEDDGVGSFRPEGSVTRAETAAMVARLAFSGLRLTPSWDLLTAIVESDGSFYASPRAGDAAAVDADIRYMLSRGERTLTLSYEDRSVTEAAAGDLMQAFLYAMRQYPEQTYNAVDCRFTAGTAVLSFHSSFYGDAQIDWYREETLSAAVAVHDALRADGTIRDDMTEYETARAYYDWLCRHCAYDFGVEDDSMSHTGYSALVEGLAVCDGYTSAYNLLLKLEGIACSTRSTEDHIWTVAVLDGDTLHIDPTWGYQRNGGDPDMDYFGMTEAESLARF